MHTGNLIEPYASQMRAGLKTLEGRAWRDKWMLIHDGDTIVFNGDIVTKVLAVRVYDSVQQMVDSEDISALVPGNDRQQAYAIYYDLYLKKLVTAGREDVPLPQVKMVVFDLTLM